MKNTKLYFLSDRVIFIDEDGNIEVHKYRGLKINLKVNTFDFFSETDGKRYVSKDKTNKLFLNLLNEPQKLPAEMVGDNDELIEVLDKVTSKFNGK